MPPELVERITGAQRLSVNFRFGTGSSVLDVKAATDIDRVAPRLAEQDMRGKEVLLAGFADSRGGNAVNVPLSLDRARAVSAKLQERGVPVAPLPSVLARSAPWHQILTRQVGKKTAEWRSG